MLGTKRKDDFEPYWEDEKDWLCIVEFLPTDHREARLFAADIIGYLAGYANPTNARSGHSSAILTPALTSFYFPFHSTNCITRPMGMPRPSPQAFRPQSQRFFQPLSTCPARTSADRCGLKFGRCVTGRRCSQLSYALAWGIVSSPQLNTGRASNCFSAASGWNRRGKEFRRHKSCDVRNPCPIESIYGCRLSLSCSGSRCCLVIRCNQGTGCRLFDEMSDRLWLRHIHGVAAFDFDDRCAGTLRHQPLRIGRKHPILCR